jgi:hypothetical protein
MLISCLAYSLTLKMEVTHSSEVSAEYQRTTRHYIPEDRALNFRSKGNSLKVMNMNPNAVKCSINTI